MTLAQELLELQNQFKDRAPKEVQEMMKQATQDLLATEIENNAAGIGDSFPDFELPNDKGELVKLSSLLKKGPAVLAFYRGGWCPYCNLELAALEKHLPEFDSLNTQLVGITPEQPDHSVLTKEKNSLSFPILTDENNDFARSLGIVFALPESIRSVYTGFGIDVEGHNGNSNFELPLPATFVIGTDGLVKYSFAKADYKKRAEPADILEVLKSL